MKRERLLKNAVVLTAGGFIAKGLGGLYRIPLANLLGGYGMGLYQMAYPLFCVLLTFSSAGIPNAFARLVASERAVGKDGYPMVKRAMKIFCMLGLCGSLVMLLLSPLISRLQGEPSLAACYDSLAPAVFMVAVIAVLRGYFQGKKDMKPTALSEVMEQLIKVTVGLYFAHRFQDEPVRAVRGTLAAVSVSEAVALGWLLLRFRGERSRFLTVKHAPKTDIWSTALPAMASSSLLPLSQMADSVIIVRLLSRYTAQAVSLYGLFSGGALALVNLPATLSYGLAVASVPTVSESFALGREEEGRERVFSVLGLTLLISLPCAFFLLLFAKPIVSLLYPALSVEDGATLRALIRICALSCVTLSGTQTLAACLTGMGRARLGARAMAIAVTVKLGVQVWLVGNPAFSVLGAAIASDGCYLVAFFLDLYYTMRKDKSKGEGNGYHRQFGGRKGRLERAYAGGNRAGRQGARPHRAYRVGADIARGGHRVRIARLRIRKEQKLSNVKKEPRE